MLDMAIGESSKIESEDKGKIDSIVGKVKELNGRMADIRREQVFQRVSTFHEQAYPTRKSYDIEFLVELGYAKPLVMGILTMCYNRNEKPNSVTNLSLQTPRSSSGL